MNKLFKIIQTVLVIFYFLFNIYLLIFNWDVFTVSLAIDYGFGIVNAPPIIIMMLLGTTILVLIWLTDYTKDLRSEVSILKKDEEINRLNKTGNDTVKILESLSSIQKQLESLTKNDEDQDQEIVMQE